MKRLILLVFIISSSLIALCQTITLNGLKYSIYNGNWYFNGNVCAKNAIYIGTQQFTATNMANAITAYGWGNHATLYWAKSDTTSTLLTRGSAINLYQPKGTYLTSQTSHSDVVVDGDFTSNGILLRSSAGVYSIATNNTVTWDATSADFALAESNYTLNMPKYYTITAYAVNTTLAISDINNDILIDNVSARTVTLPLNSAVTIPVGSTFNIIRFNTGTVQIIPASGVTLVSANSYRYVSVRYGVVTLKKISTDGWVMYGNLSAS